MVTLRLQVFVGLVLNFCCMVKHFLYKSSCYYCIITRENNVYDCMLMNKPYHWML